MLIAAILATSIVLGAHPVAAGIAAVAIVEPRFVLVGAAGWGLLHVVKRRRGDGAEREAAFLRALAAELRAGTSLRLALTAAGRESDLGLERAIRLAEAGAPMGRVAKALSQQLHHNGPAAAAAFELSSHSGARTAHLFEVLAERAAERAELNRERRTATTQARLSAWVVGVAPLLFTALLLAAGGLESVHRAGGAGAAVLGAGLAFQLAGLAVVTVILRRAIR